MPASAHSDSNTAGAADKSQQHHRLPSHAKVGASSAARVQKLIPDSDSDDDRKPLFPIPTTDARTKAKKPARASTPEVLELSSGSDDDDNVTAQLVAVRAQQDAADAKRAERKARADAARELIVAAVPDADEVFLAKAFARCGHDANKTVDDVLGTNYPLRGGGWNFGKAPQQRRDQRGVLESDQDDDDSDSELEVTAPAKGKQRKAAPLEAPAKDKRKNKDDAVVAKKVKGKKRVRPQSDESEVDQLASDSDTDAARSSDDGDDEPAIVYTKDDALDEETYWLDPQQHKAGGDSYRKAALKQLFRDYETVTQGQIRKLFDKYHELYAPAWMALWRKKKADDLVELRGSARDADYIHLPNGRVKKRDPGPRSKFLDREIAWLEKYVAVGGCKRKMARDEPNLDQANDSDEPRQKKKETKEQRRARTSAASGSGSGQHKAKSAAKVQLKPKASSSGMHQKKKQRGPFSGSDESETGGYDDVELDAAARRAECLGSDDGHDGDRNSAGWGPEGAAGTFNKRRRNGGAFGRRFGGGGAGASGAYGVKEEEVEPFSGAGFRLGD
ncbi:hypothetical protein JCM9279_001179 [Rhodotorula babjevae]